MKYLIVGRNFEVTDVMQTNIKSKLAKLEKFFLVNNAMECRVVITALKIGQKIEVTIPTNVAVLRAEVVNES